MSEHVTHTLTPWVDSNSRVLVLGTMPSPKSRARGMYYGHPQNRFWRTLAALWQETPPGDPVSARAFAARHGIALWDVLAECHINGAADASISDPVPNDIVGLLMHYPNIQAIVTTGKKAADLLRRYSAQSLSVPVYALPSTSAANRGWWPDDKLLDAYRPLIVLAEGGAVNGSL